MVLLALIWFDPAQLLLRQVWVCWAPLPTLLPKNNYWLRSALMMTLVRMNGLISLDRIIALTPVIALPQLLVVEGDPLTPTHVGLCFLQLLLRLSLPFTLKLAPPPLLEQMFARTVELLQFPLLVSPQFSRLSFL
ncbi:uncharacterized protein LOC18108273 isoform X2 [Populus trichocarpa]|uniref:Uncharacterized protein n=1 Tax=Populus trichocarpa TaxID=3694 RepID=U5FEQ2_POPTR|nr:uncharacterized protein LOC18108273 isoform X2 [Populus trichocarpa]|eukprot:XP_006371223.1 uncharacterized protein LOC18108273 isoform X2 [Populus trichocarpa]